jgi:hypothetical protein
MATVLFFFFFEESYHASIKQAFDYNAETSGTPQKHQLCQHIAQKTLQKGK